MAGGFVVKKPAAVLHGGPRDGFGYYIDDLHAMQAAAEHFGHDFGYRPTGEKCRHPGAAGEVESEIWRFSGHTEAPARREIIESKVEKAVLGSGRAGVTLRELAIAARCQQYVVEEIVERLVAEGVYQRSPTKPYYYRAAS